MPSTFFPEGKNRFVSCNMFFRTWDMDRIQKLVSPQFIIIVSLSSYWQGLIGYGPVLLSCSTLLHLLVIGILKTKLSAELDSDCFPWAAFGTLTLLSLPISCSPQLKDRGLVNIQYAALPLASLHCCQVILLPTSLWMLWTPTVLIYLSLQEEAGHMSACAFLSQFPYSRNAVCLIH
jgi:hypothetical protein